ncbi:hypothetical protein ALP75_204874 [Pseudomonas syringae pv. actinidiae]|nr:hypothetical protein ALP75_204874 [Pseudomonas syringae pv. actinidiae]
MHFLFTEGADQGLRNLVRAPRIGHQLAEHGAQAKDDADETQHAAEAVLEGFHDFFYWHSRRQAKKACRQCQRDEGVNLEGGDQQHKADDGHQRIDEQERLMGHTEHGCFFGYYFKELLTAPACVVCAQDSAVFCTHAFIRRESLSTMPRLAHQSHR